MEDPKWLRLITIGLVLAAVAIGYLLFTGRFSSNTARFSPLPSVSPSKSAQISSSSPAPAAGRVADRLPRTAFPAGAGVIFSLVAIAAGWGLCKFPK